MANSDTDRLIPKQVARLVGHGGTALTGVLLIVSGIATIFSSLPPVLAIAQVVFGIAAIVLAYASWHGSRIGWAFSITIDATCGLIVLFGSLKIAHLTGLPLVAAAVPCVIAKVSWVMLATLGADYDR
jgi:hypothetical protein